MADKVCSESAVETAHSLFADNCGECLPKLPVFVAALAQARSSNFVRIANRSGNRFGAAGRGHKESEVNPVAFSVCNAVSVAAVTEQNLAFQRLVDGEMNNRLGNAIVRRTDSSKPKAEHATFRNDTANAIDDSNRSRSAVIWLCE